MAPEPHSGLFCGEGRSTSKYVNQEPDACQGDSGGALVCQTAGADSAVVVGIIAYGSGCGMAGNPGVYTSVYYHKQWITAIINNK